MKLRIFRDDIITCLQIPIVSDETKNVQYSDLPRSVQVALKNIYNPLNYLEVLSAFEKYVSIEGYNELIQLVSKK